MCIRDRTHTCALTLDRTALCWGNNNFGQLGDGGTVARLAPTLVGGGVTFQSIDVGDPWSCGLSTTGKAYCWGGLEGFGVATTPHLYAGTPTSVSYTHLRAHETPEHLVCRLLLEKKK